MYHVTSSRNRASIERYGLDLLRMAAAPGIAGSLVPEVEGCYLCEIHDVDWFAEVINTTGGAVDVWEVDVRGLKLVEAPEGYRYYPGSIPPDRVFLVEEDRQRQQQGARGDRALRAR